MRNAITTKIRPVISLHLIQVGSILLLTLSLHDQASARIGETFEQCIERYGEVVEKRGNDGYVFEKNELKITCFISQASGKCVSISYFPLDQIELSKEKKLDILKVVWEGAQAKEIKDDQESFLINTKTGDYAVMDRASLIIFSREAIQKIKGTAGL